MRFSFVLLTLALTAGNLFSQSDNGLFIQDISWSPDGKQIAFTGMHDIDQKANTLKADIYVVSANGGVPKRITGDEKNEFYTSWAKGRIAFSAGVPNLKESEIYTSKADGSDVIQLTKAGLQNSTPALSKDGKKIAFVSTRDGGKYQIYVANADGSGLKRLSTDNQIGYFNPQWSSDGKRILYYAEKGDRRDQIWTMNADGTAAKLLTGGVGHNIFPGWSPDGKHIIFSSSQRDAASDGSYIEGSFLYVMDPDGSGLRKLGDIKSFFARYSPDGKKIAYVAGRFPRSEIFVANADGSGAIKITR